MNSSVIFFDILNFLKPLIREEVLHGTKQAIAYRIHHRNFISSSDYLYLLYENKHCHAAKLPVDFLAEKKSFFFNLSFKLASSAL